MNTSKGKLKPTEVRDYRQKLLKEQGGVCILCGYDIAPGQDTLDHCHEQGHVRAVLHRNCNGIEGRIKSWVARAGKHIDPVDFLEAIIKHWTKTYQDMPLHPNHLCEKGVEIKTLRKRLKRVKKERTKQKYRDRIKKLQQEINNA